MKRTRSLQGSLLFCPGAWSAPMNEDSSNLFGKLFDAPARRVVPVLVPMPAPTAYSYAVPDGVTVAPGAIVQVPLGPRQVIGVVWDGEDVSSVDPKKLREITKSPCKSESQKAHPLSMWPAAAQKIKHTRTADRKRNCEL